MWLVGSALAAVGFGLARAQSAAEQLVWDAPNGCPLASAVLARVQRELAGRNLADRAWSAHAQVRVRAERYRLELTLYWPGGEASRELEAVRCDALAAATGVLISLALADAIEAQASPPPTAAAPAAPPAAATSAPAAVRSSEPRDSATQQPPKPDAPEQSATGGLPSSGESDWPWRYGLAASFRLDVGMLPQQPAFGIGPRLMLQVGPLQAIAGLTFWIVARSQPESYPSARLEGGGVLGDLDFGFELLARPVRLAPCLVLEHGQLHVSSSDVSMPDHAQFSWTAAGGGVRAAIALGAGLHAGLEVLGLAPWSRQRLWLHTSGGDVPLFESAPLVLRVSAELAYVFE